LANTQCYILDPFLQPVPMGVAGELHIGGHGVARGYLNRTDLTTQKFIVNPFTAEGAPPDLNPGPSPSSSSRDPASRLYKTGDLVRYQPDGLIEYLGRLDEQVKIRGHRIEPGEVEATLRQHNGIADALVVARDDGHGAKRLVGYVVSRNGPLTAADLREFVRQVLPAYMVPAQFVMLTELPRTPNGKIDRLRLPAPETAAASAMYLAPRDSLEQTLAEIWQDALGVRQVGRDDDFFELGGDSLSATRVFARITRRLGKAIALREVLENPRFSSLAQALRDSPTSPARPPIARRPRRQIELAR
jgi:acyl carrier protein